MYAYESILQFQTERVKSAYARQILDSNHPAYGVFLSERSGQHPNADHTCNASDLASACYVFLAEGSELENDDELFDRIQKSIVFQRRWQRPTGLIDLVSINWESPPDNNFARHYPVSGLWRVKRDKLSATAATNNRTVFSVRYGDINLRAVKFSGTYMSVTNFAADTMETIDGGIRLSQKGANRRPPGYDLPLNQEVRFGQFGQMKRPNQINDWA